MLKECGGQLHLITTQQFQKWKPWARALGTHGTHCVLLRLEHRTAVVSAMVGLLWRGLLLVSPKRRHCRFRVAWSVSMFTLCWGCVLVVTPLNSSLLESLFLNVPAPQLWCFGEGCGIEMIRVYEDSYLPAACCSQWSPMQLHHICCCLDFFVHYRLLFQK